MRLKQLIIMTIFLSIIFGNNPLKKFEISGYSFNDQLFFSVDHSNSMHIISNIYVGLSLGVDYFNLQPSFPYALTVHLINPYKQISPFINMGFGNIIELEDITNKPKKSGTFIDARIGLKRKIEREVSVFIEIFARQQHVKHQTSDEIAIWYFNSLDYNYNRNKLENMYGISIGIFFN